MNTFHIPGLTFFLFRAALIVVNATHSNVTAGMSILSSGTSLAKVSLWRGKRIDPAGFIYLDARYYDGVGGRFLSPDPAGHEGSWELYSFANGNTVKDEAGTATGDLYDAENRLIKRGANIEIGYDHEGNRVWKAVSGVTTYYLLDEPNPRGYVQVLAEYQNLANPPERAYTYGHGLLAQRRNTGTAAAPVWTTSYYGYDGQGSARMLFDTGSPVVVTDTYDYDAYGMVLASTPSAATGSPTPNHYRYTGQQWDDDLKMYYLRARYYKPDTHRFWTRDTFQGDREDPLSLHKYLYCSANPVNQFDPSGHEMDFDSGKGFEVHEKFCALALAALQVTKWADKAIGVAVLSLDGDPDSGLKPDNIATGKKVWYELKPISHKTSPDLRQTTGNTLWHYGTLLGQAGIMPGLPQRLVPQNFQFTTITDPEDGQRLEVWLEAGDVPGLIYYYFKKPRNNNDDDDDDGFRVPVPIVLPDYNPAARAVYLTGGRAAAAARNVAIIGTVGLVTYFAIATFNSARGAL